MNSKKDLIIFSFDFPPSNGGIARLCQEIAVGMKPYYNTIKVLTRTKKGINIPYNLNEVQVIALPNKRILCEIEAVKYLSSIKYKDNYDILCGTWHPEATLSLISGFKNVFVLGHGAEFTSGGSFLRKAIWLRFYAKLVLNNVKLTIANSNYTKNLVHNIAGFAECIELPLGVNHNFFKPNFNLENRHNSFKICTVSRIEQFKGHDFIARVLLKIHEREPNIIEWNVAGTGSYLEKLINVVEGLGIQNMVKFHGFVKDVDLPTFYNQNDLFILCTRESPDDINVEGFGLVFLEAQSSGIPAIGTKTGGISDAIDVGNGGWLIEQDNESELYNLLISLLDNRSITKTEGLKARERVENGCTWECYCENLFKLLER